MSWRRLGVLVTGLPQTSRLRTRLRDEVEYDPSSSSEEPKHGPWSTTHYMFADLLDAVQNLTAAVYESQSGEPMKRPDPYPRPRLKVRKTAAEVVQEQQKRAAVESLLDIRRQFREQQES